MALLAANPLTMSATPPCTNDGGKNMPFASGRRHEFWTADVRYIDHRMGGGQAYVPSVLENLSHAILASGLFQSQDLTALLSVRYAAGTADKPTAVSRPELFETPFVTPQPRLFDLPDAGWLEALRLLGYAPRKRREPMLIQDVLFSYLEAL